MARRLCKLFSATQDGTFDVNVLRSAKGMGALNYCGDPDDEDEPEPEPEYGNFDIILDQISRVSQLHPTPHAPCSMLYLVPMLVVC